MNSADARIADSATATDSVAADQAATAHLNRQQFRKLLARNVAVPIGFGLVSVMFFLVIINYLLALGRWIESTDKAIATTYVVKQLLVDHETGLRGFLITGKEEYLEPFHQAERTLGPTMASLKAQVGESGPQQARIERINESYASWRRYADEAIELKRNGKAVEAIVGSGRGKNLMEAIRQQARDLVVAEQEVKDQRSQRSQTLVTALSIGYFALSLLFSALMAHGGRRQLQGLAETYSEALSRQMQQTEVLRQQTWLRSGQSQLADRIIGQLPLPILCQNILGFLADYLDVVIGAVYIGLDEKKFDRIAAYGFSREMAEREQSFESREGLVGQAAADRRPLILDPLIPDYFKVNSGLGEGRPVAVAVLPIISDNTVHAVIELGFLRPLDARDAEFLELISENIGAALVAAGYRRRLHEALLDMQQLNDELQAQQEELRIANEELEEQSQALEQSRAQLEEQQSELEHSNATLEEQHEVLRSNNEILQHTQQLLEQHARQLEQSSRYKSEFIANMSHELRTPLNSSLILSKLLAENGTGNLTKEQIKYAESIYAAGNDLLALINDVLDISRVEAGKLEVIADQIATPRLLDTLAQHFRLLAQQKQLDFDVSIEADAPQALRSDGRRLEQILRNLLSNAIKFTERGSVLLRVAAAPHRQISFAVVDTGIGLDAEQQAHVFEPFYQADSSVSRKFGGTGLGLSISQQLAGLLGGRITLSSEPGVGSIFTLVIPIDYQPRAAVELAAPESGPRLQLARPAPSASTVHFNDDRDRLSVDRKTILIVEDELAFAQILFDLARELDYQCLVALSAEEGFELLAQHTPHAILLDMKLPDQTGMSVLAGLKEDPRTRHVPVHVISVEDRAETALQMGAIGYLVKPASRDQLREIFVAIEAKISQKMKHVLVVESPSQSDATARLIADVDVEVVTAASGQQALELLKSQTFDCLIVDLELADMSGEELLQKMSSSDMFSFPPVIVHASRDLTREEEEKLLRFSRSIIIKSARSPERLLDEVTLFLHKVEADLSPERRSLLQRARSSARALEGRKILVVDDDVRNIFAITSVLETNGAVVEIGRNGIDAIKKLDECKGIELVLMDIMMPEMDGYQAMEHIRKNPAFAKLPIIAVTARAMRDDQERCLRAGANDYVAKPVDMDRLISLMRVWLPKIQRA